MGRTMTGGTKTIVIIGGGASGVLLTLQLLAQPQPLKVTLIERSDLLGRGLAYATNDDAHLLNVTPLVLSAFPEDAEHFWRWLHATGRVATDAPVFSFVARRHFGDYLDAMLLQARQSSPGRFNIVRGEVSMLDETPRGIEVRLTNGTSVPGHVAVLATGHDDDCAADEATAGIDPLSPLPVMILGTGLSLVDRWLSLRHAGYHGRIIALSRRGLLPRPHTGVPAMRLDAADIPFGTGMTYFTRWLRQTAQQIIADSGDWRAVTDALRPYAQRLWQSWSSTTRRRFLTHARAWWDVHRHRLAPAVHKKLMAEVLDRRLEAIAAKPVEFQCGVAQQSVSYRRRGATVIETVEVAAVLDCRGIAKDWQAHPETLAGRLIASGRARTDELHLGLDVTPRCQLLNGNGDISERLYAVGPLTRDTFFEIEAIPDIRAQSATLAKDMAGGE